MRYIGYWESPLGWIRWEGTVESITRLQLVGLPADDVSERSAPWMEEAVHQLSAYLAGRLDHFDLPLQPEGTPFQLQVWDELRRIPYGETCSYRELAGRIGRPKACRAVGSANAQNPIPILIPCHRVVQSSGALGGYSFGLPGRAGQEGPALKRWLLELEQTHRL
ncbi:MAG: methylated-DNA--[protein]-cysteine S-methyltransferase [Parabacteroides sp.]